MDEMAVDIEQAGAILGFVHQMVVPDLVVQRGRLGHELQLRKMILREQDRRRSAPTRETWAAPQRARISSEVAEVANRPKKRPGSRERSSITIGATRWQAILVRFRTI